MMMQEPTPVECTPLQSSPVQSSPSIDHFKSLFSTQYLHRNCCLISFARLVEYWSDDDISPLSLLIESIEYNFGDKVSCKSLKNEAGMALE